VILRIVSFSGLLAFLGLAWLISERRRDVCWRTVYCGIGLQLALGLIVLKTRVGNAVFDIVRHAFIFIIDSSRAGAEFVFGPLVIPDQFVFFITVPCVLIFLSSLMALLYHWGIMQRVVRGMAWVMYRTMRITGKESLAAAANVFVGMTEAPLFIRPYLDKMTRSELMVLMTCGLATIAGTVMAVYASMGIDAGHLLTASVMSAPAALVFAKIMVPAHRGALEDKTPLVTEFTREKAVNSFDAITIGARDGLRLALNVVAMLIAVLSLLMLANKLLGLAGGLLGFENITLQSMFGYAGYPIALLMGITPGDAHVVGELLSTKIFLTELVAYKSLVEHLAVLSPRSITIATYALCGFANFGSIAILLGALSTLAPHRRKDVAQLVWKALVGGALASFSTATIAGMLL